MRAGARWEAVIDLRLGDCLATLRAMPDASVDSVVTDPPYGLGKEPKARDVLRAWLDGEEFKPGGAGFMGKAWDAFVPSPLVWSECLRVLKPGGHLVAFAGSRTYDWIVMGVRLAGFEVRDQLIYLYGSGFPKSMNVSKAIDSHERGRLCAQKIGYFMGDRGMTARDLSEMAGLASAASIVDWVVGGHCPSDRNWRKIADALGVTAEEEARFERVIVEKRASSDRRNDGSTYGLGHNGTADITAPATDDARTWEGWGTAIKPAHEPIVLARKPLSGTVAANVLEHGTGAINVDGCRVVATDKTPAPVGVYGRPSIGTTGHTGERNGSADSLGRWPANILHDGSPEVLAVFPETGAAMAGDRGAGMRGFVYGHSDQAFNNVSGVSDAGGSAARYFYSAKASRAERELGLADFAPETVGDGRQAANDTADQRGKTERRNTHPTCKPVSVMRWLVRLITPPGGTIVDPFTGSGTTGVAAALEGFGFIGCELSTEYVEIARARIAHARKFPAMWEPDYVAPDEVPDEQLDLFGS